MHGFPYVMSDMYSWVLLQSPYSQKPLKTTAGLLRSVMAAVSGKPWLFSLYHLFYMPPQDERDNGDIIEWSKGSWWRYLGLQKLLLFHSCPFKRSSLFLASVYTLLLSVSLFARTFSLARSVSRLVVTLNL